MTSPLPRRSTSPSGVPHRVVLTLLASSGWLISGTAFAQPAAQFTLRWEAPAGCPQREDVRERIRKLTGGASAAPAALQAEGTITQTDGTHFHLKLVTRSGRLVGERNLDATSCANLSGAAAVSLALLLRAEEPLSAADLGEQQTNAATGGASRATGTAAVADAATQAEKEPSKGSARADADAEEIIQRPIRIPTSSRKWRVLAQAPLAAVSFGPLPKPSWGVAFAGGVSFDDWRFLLGGSAWLRQGMIGEESPDYGAEVDRLTGTLRACRALRASAFEVAPCLVLSLEHISARGTGPDITAHAQQVTWLGLGVGAQGRLYLASWFSVLLGVDAQIETARPRFAIDGVGNLGQLGRAAFSVSVGPEWIL